MIKFILSVIAWCEKSLQEVENNRLAAVAAADVKIGLLKVEQEAAKAEQAVANKIRTALASLKP